MKVLSLFPQMKDKVSHYQKHLAQLFCKVLGCFAKLN